MMYEPMAAREYGTSGDLRAGYNAVRRKFFGKATRGIAEQCARDHKTILSLRERVQQQLAEITGLVEQTKAYQAQIDDLRYGISERKAEVASLDERLKKINEAVKASGTVLNFKVALEAVSHVYGMAPQLIKGPSRDRIAVVARKHLVQILTTHRSDLSYPMLGRLLGNRDHTTIIHARKAWGKVSHKFEREVAAVNRLLGVTQPVASARIPEISQESDPCSDKIAACG